MSASKLPARPSLDSLRKQAKKLARAIVVGDAAAVARARAQLPQPKLPLSQRDAQLVLAREYGFSGWKDLVKEVKQRLGKGLEWAVSEARRIIHDNDVEALRQLLAEYPDLLSWKADENDGGLLGMATGSYGDSGDEFRETHFTRLTCAELLLDAGAVVVPSILNGLIYSRAKRLIDLFHRRGLFPRSLKFFVALGDFEGVRAFLNTNSDDLAAVSEAFLVACHLEHAKIAALLLDRCITLDSDLARRIDDGPGRSGFIQAITKTSLIFTDAEPDGLWQEFVMREVVRAEYDSDRSSFIDILRREAWVLGDRHVRFQAGVIQQAVLHDHEAFITDLLDLNPALLHGPVRPPSNAIDFAFIYVKTDLLSTLLRIWPMPDDLPHAAGSGDLVRVKKWFDAEGKPALGDLANHSPTNNAGYRGDFRTWFGREPNVQHVLDTAFAWAVMNNHFEVADFLLEHGADVNTNWSSHEPASILHELVWRKNYEAMQFLIDRGIDMTIRDYRWGSTPEGWASYFGDEKMAQWLRDAQQRREQASH
jgi:hypothetical protein